MAAADDMLALRPGQSAVQLKDANVEHPSGAWWQITAEMHQEDQLDPVSAELAGALTANMPAMLVSLPGTCCRAGGPFP